MAPSTQPSPKDKSVCRHETLVSSPPLRSNIIDEVESVDLSKPDLYLNRELNWLEFNSKVLNEGVDKQSPLLEQLKFLSIFHSNLDEFFMVRVSGILEQYISQAPSLGSDKTPPARQLAEIRRNTVRLLNKGEEHWRKYLSKQLQERGVRIVRYNSLTRKQKRFLEAYFLDELFPILTPQAIDPSHPLPTISNLSLNFIVFLTDSQGIVRYARIKCPNNISRFVFTPRNKEAKTYAALGFSSGARDNDIVLIEDLIQAHLHLLFPGHTIVHVGVFRITRNTDLELAEDEAGDLLEAVRDLVDQRRFGNVVRLEVNHNMPSPLIRFLVHLLRLTPFQVYKTKLPLAFADMMALYGLGRAGLKEAPITPYVPPMFTQDKLDNLFRQVREKPALLFHPYNSFTPVQDFVRQASTDPKVMAIKQTLYRCGNDSPIVKSLIEARRAGKQVTAVVELKARFDEALNITWAEELEKAGIHVVYGLPGMKVHAKLCLVVRKEANGVRRYAHIGTGNYNPATAKIYSDLGIITAHPGICADVTDVFNVMTGYAIQDEYRHLLVSPATMRKHLLCAIDQEIAQHQKHGNGNIHFKCNQLVDEACIQALYRASMYGVKVHLQIRGVCCIKPGLPGISENIEVSSLVGRFLEHTRLFAFYNNGTPLLYIGSADLMPRNLDRRIEVLTPILDPKLCMRIYKNILKPHFEDTEKTYLLQADGTYIRREAEEGAKPFNVQEHLLKRASKGF